MFVASISPDGQTLLSVGDSNEVYLHNIRGGSVVSFNHVATHILPSPDYSGIPSPSSSLVASFSTSFSGDGYKYAVASQEGVVAVWDVRSTKPMKVYHTNKIRQAEPPTFSTAAGGLWDNPWEWTRGGACGPGWSARNVKFGGNRSGKEILTFTEHTALVHVIDARTFEAEEIIHVPCLATPPSEGQPSINRQGASAISPTGPQCQSAIPLTTMRRTSAIRRQPFYTFPSPSPSPRPQSAARIIPGSRSRIATSLAQGRAGNSSIVHALGDAFRVAYSPPDSIGDSTWRTLHGLPRDRESRSTAENAAAAERERGREREDRRWQSEFDDLVVIPALGDEDVESEVHALFEANEANSEDGENEDDEMVGIRSRRWRRREAAESANPTTAMEVDELESDCNSSREPSRSSSPAPQRIIGVSDISRSFTSPPPAGWSTASTTSGSTRARVAALDDDDIAVDVVGEDEEMDLGEFDEVSSLMLSKSDLRYDNDLNIAGVCFDPKGHSIYVGSSQSIAAWNLRGADKTWWVGSQWR